MKRAVVLIFTVLSLGGCAVPVPLQVASWALDGLSYLATKKSVTDHGISMVAQKDCALFRGITEGEICREWDNRRILIADIFDDEQRGVVAEVGNEEIPVSVATESKTLQINNTFSSSDELLTSISVVDNITLNEVRINQSINWNSKFAHNPSVSDVKSGYSAIKKIDISPVTTKVDLPIMPLESQKSGQLSSIQSHEPMSGIYWVIGSFRNYSNAILLVEDFDQLKPEVLAAKPGVKSVYRVVVGPIIAGEERKLHSRVLEAGLRDIWAIRIRAGDWFVARKFQDMDHYKQELPAEEIAGLPQ